MKEETKIVLKMKDATETIRHLIDDGEEIRIEATQSRNPGQSMTLIDKLVLTNNTCHWGPSGAFGLLKQERRPTCIPVRDWMNHKLVKIHPDTVVHIYKRKLQHA